MDTLELIGYLASLLVAVSLSLKSITKLRWVNMIGSLVFGTYGILIAAYPVAVVNYYIALINMYHLYKIYALWVYKKTS